MKTIDITPTWVYATRIYIEVLKNPKAGAEAIEAAEKDLMVMAETMDCHKERGYTLTPEGV